MSKPMRAVRKVLPESEFRRTYAKALVRRIQGLSGVSTAEAQRALALVIPMLEEMVYSGESIDLGFMALNVRTTRPGSFTTGFAPEKQQRTYMVGESLRWWVRLRRSWLERVRPAWSRF